MFLQPHGFRQVDTQTYLPVLQSLLAEGNEVSLLLTGSSMTPFLADKRDTILIRRPQGAFRRGEMVFYRRRSGQYIMHRIHHIGSDGLYLVGDAQWEIEGPIAPEQVFGEIFSVIRKGTRVGPGDFWWEFFEHVWIHMIPLRRTVMRLYARLRGH